MIVCICKRVTERKIAETITEGAMSVEAVGRACRAGTGCGACHEQIQQMIDCAGCEARCDRSPAEVLSPYLVPGRAA